MDITTKIEEIRTKYNKLIENKFNSYFDGFSLFNKDSENYTSNLKIFKYLFSLDEEAKTYLWNELDTRSYRHFNDLNLKDFSNEEIDFFKSMHDTLNNHLNEYHIFGCDININDSFQSENLTIKPFNESTINEFKNYFNNNYQEYMDFHLNKELILDNESYKYDSQLKFSIILDKTDQYIGMIKLTNITDAGLYNIEYFINKEFRCRGYAKEAINLLLKLIKNKKLIVFEPQVRDCVYKKIIPEINCIVAKIDETNIASNNLIKKIGFKYSGKEYFFTKYNNKIINLNDYYYFFV